jgi:hypothetical protein
VAGQALWAPCRCCAAPGPSDLAMEEANALGERDSARWIGRALGVTPQEVEGAARGYGGTTLGGSTLGEFDDGLGFV